MSASFTLLTERLEIRWLALDDAPLILELVNDPDWIRYIGDKRVQDLDAARNYLESGPLAIYRERGFGLNRIGLRGDDTPIGICGILQRDSRPNPDLGFALLPRYRRRGYAAEATAAVLEHARDELGLDRIVAILGRQNLGCRALLLRLGFAYDGEIIPETHGAAVDLYNQSPH